MQKVFITGLGTISSIGDNVNASLHSLINKKPGISEIEILKTSLRLPSGEIKKDNKELKKIAGIKSKKTFSRSSLLGIIAAKEALHLSGIDPQQFKTGLFNGTSVGGMDRGEIFYKNYLQHTKINLSDAIVHDCGEGTMAITNFLNISGFSTTVSTACSSAANAIMQAAKMIKAGLLDCALAGGADGFSIFTINGFNSLMILSAEKCRPFDKNRNGLNLGEGAGFIMLESEKNMLKSKSKPLAELTGYGNACDAFHQTASSENGQGAYLAMAKALAVNNIKQNKISYINAHGTATINNDLSEGTAIERIFQNNVPPYSSTKAFTGHTLAASGGIEAVFSVLAIQNGLVFPNLNFEEKSEGLLSLPEKNLLQNKNIQHVMSNSFGFGGNNSSLIFSKC